MPVSAALRGRARDLRRRTRETRERDERGEGRWWQTERVMDYDERDEELGGDGETADGEEEEKSCFRNEKLQIRAEERVDILLIL